jgi:hypothetical protein
MDGLASVRKRSRARSAHRNRLTVGARRQSLLTVIPRSGWFRQVSRPPAPLRRFTTVASFESCVDLWKQASL